MARRFDDPKPSRKAQANKAEKKLAKRLGGHRQPCSGAIPGHRGDVKLDTLLIDHKGTAARSFRVTVEDLAKITREANGEGKEPALVIEFEGVTTIYREWVVYPLALLEEKQ